MDDDEEVYKPTVRYNGSGSEGNIYCILGKSRTALREIKRNADYKEMANRVYNSQSEEEALCIMGEYVKLVDTSEAEM